MDLSSFLALVEEKYNHEHVHDPHRATHVPYLNGLRDEVAEVAEEIKPDNHVYLEDELGDMLRDSFNLIYTLAKQGYIRSPEAVLERAIRKYRERMDDKKNGVVWSETKARQKGKLEKEYSSFLKNDN